MKKTYLTVSLGLLLFSCSPESGGDSQKPTPQPEQDLYQLVELTGGDNVKFLYEEGKIMKGVGDSPSGYDAYDDAFQVFYGENGLVEKVIESEGYFEKPIDFSFDLTSGDYYISQVYNYQYEGDRLDKITDDNGNLIIEFTYNSNGLITEIFEAESSSSYWIYNYYYNAEGILESYTFTGQDSGTSYTEGGKITTDDKINPLFYHWKNFRLIIPTDVSGITTYNVIGYPHNVTEIYDGNELDFKAQLEYDESGHPIYYRETLDDIDAVVFDYLE
ncbi:hypothetical protein [Salinimicrobium sediminilitoris]|uniref:hypothetical protein n=1 Tax=Salinimicrobium sediminilitoris TaxID=2876715 RepID=UPI001E5509B1|nr:hypothetical protein [Salinimicrobium sediminilitoris]MCC8361004.1 hypothetical protein [Salinimicrobium sediminilitoris]